MLTRSLCPVCRDEIEADVALGTFVHIIKICPKHGAFVGMVERDPEWFLFCRKQNRKSIYDGYMIDVTSRCNLRCKYCYHPCAGGDRPKEEIIFEASGRAYDAPFILTGGEPTLHPDIAEIVSRLNIMAETWLLTNGVKLLDDALFDRLCEAGLREGSAVRMALSFHKESAGADHKVLECARARGLTIGTSFWVIDDLTQIDEAVATYREFRDVLMSMRVKVASQAWNTENVPQKIFVSDMIKHMQSLGALRIDTEANNKVNYGNVVLDGMTFKLISWSDITNVDLNDIDCPPYYRALDGTVNNLLTTLLKNQRSVAA